MISRRSAVSVCLLVAAWLLPRLLWAADTPAVIAWPGVAPDDVQLRAVVKVPTVRNAWQKSSVQVFLIDSEKDLKALWTGLKRMDAVPEIDFGNYSLVYLPLTARSVQVKEQDGKPTLDFAIAKPPPGKHYVLALFPKKTLAPLVEKEK
jgi:hypothetical protein